MTGRVRIGISAWRYEPWRKVFYPKGLAQHRELHYASRQLPTIEINGMFCSLQKPGPFLWQLPPSRHDERVAGRCSLRIDSNRGLRHAIEIRHESFRDPAFVKLLRRQKIGLVVADTAGKWPLVEDVTADFVYVRLHGDTVLYTSGYSDAALADWARRIRAWSRGGEVADARKIVPGLAPPPRKSRDVYCYFDNDAKVHAPFDARRLIALLAGT